MNKLLFICLCVFAFSQLAASQPYNRDVTEDQVEGDQVEEVEEVEDDSEYYTQDDYDEDEYVDDDEEDDDIEDDDDLYYYGEENYDDVSHYYDEENYYDVTDDEESDDYEHFNKLDLAVLKKYLESLEKNSPKENYKGKAVDSEVITVEKIEQEE